MENDVNKLLRFFIDSDYRFIILAYRGKYNHLSDREYLEKLYKATCHKELDLDDPISFNEKLQWLKLNDRKSIYTQMVDKIEAKEYVEKILGPQVIVPTLAIWDNVDEMDPSGLPNQFVLKCSHNSGGVIVCKDKGNFNWKATRKYFKKELDNNFYNIGREWPYKDVKPRLFAEQYLRSIAEEDLYDYKFFCFNGLVKCFKIDFDRFTNHKANYYDSYGNLLNFGEASYPPDYDRVLPIPANLDRMKEYAELLARDTIFSRIDFYNIQGNIYFGEITFFPAGGLGTFDPDDADIMLGSWLTLPRK